MGLFRQGTSDILRHCIWRDGILNIKGFVSNSIAAAREKVSRGTIPSRMSEKVLKGHVVLKKRKQGRGRTKAFAYEEGLPFMKGLLSMTEEIHCC